MILDDPWLVLIGAWSSEFGYNSVLDSVNLEAHHVCNLVLHDINAERRAQSLYTHSV